MASVSPDVETETADLLVELGALDTQAIAHARRVQKGSGERLDQLVVKLGLVREDQFARAMSERLSLSVLPKSDYPVEPVLSGLISTRFLQDARVLPVEETPEGLILAMANPLDRFACQSIEFVTGRKVIPIVGVASELDEALNRLYAKDKTTIESGPEDSDDVVDLDVERLRDLASEAPVIRMVNDIIATAVESRASDIHIEPSENHLRVRIRVDGVLQDVEPPPAGQRAAIISRIKILAKLNIAERRLPQDGRMRLVVRGAPIDLRISTYPTMHGEAAVLRVLDRDSVALDFAALGIGGQNLEDIRKIIRQPHGIFLVTGPTGSGKTTTLYTCLKQLNAPEKKLVTIEDPIEYELEGVNQIQVRPNIGLTFAAMLRSILRVDPDIIMVGEIRDLETAEVASQAALTGHLVLSTLHTNDAPSSITRLLEMGLEDYLLASTLAGVAAQRLVRVLCPHCKSAEHPLPDIAKELKLERYFPKGAERKVYRPIGCDACNGTGFSGRSSIVEVLPMNDEIRQLILRQADAQEIHKVAVKQGMRTMFDDGMSKVVSGETAISEVLRVTREN